MGKNIFLTSHNGTFGSCALKSSLTYDDLLKRKSYKLDKEPGMILARDNLFKKFSVSNKNIVDLATGRGFMLEGTLPQKPKLAIGIDASEKMLEEAIEILSPKCPKETTIHLVHGDIFYLKDIVQEKTKDKIDLVTAANIFCFLDKSLREEILIQSLEILKPRGVLAVLTRSLDNGTFPTSWKDTDIERYSSAIWRTSQNLKCVGWTPVDWENLFIKCGFKKFGWFVGSSQTDEEISTLEVDPDVEVIVNDNLIFWGEK